MGKMNNKITEESAPGTENMDRIWMTTFWETFSDFVVDMDARYKFRIILKKANSTFILNNVIGTSFLDIAVDKDRTFVLSELELLRTTDVTYRRFTFLSKLGRYYRMTLVPAHREDVFLGLRGIAVDVTEQSLNEITLNWQRAIIEGGSDFVSIADIDGNVLYTNPGAYKMTGYNPESGELLPDRVFTPEHLKSVRGEGLGSALISGFWVSQSNLICADGTLKPIEHNMFSVRNNKDETILIANIIRDITDFVEHEKIMRNEQQRTELFTSIAMSFSLSDDFDANMNEVLKSIGSYLGADAAFIFRDSKELHCFICDYLWTSGAKHILYPGKEFPTVIANTGEYVPEYTLLQETPVYAVDDMSRLDSRLFSNIRGAGMKSMICLPIHVVDQFWGFIGLGMFAVSRKWIDRDMDFLKTISGILSTSLEKRLMAQRWQAAQANLQAVLDNVPSVIYWKDIKMNYLGANRRFMDFYGVKEKDIIGKRTQELLSFDDALHREQLDMQLIESGEDALHEIVQTVAANGKPRWISQSRVLMRGRMGEITSLLGVFDDITESRAIEQRAVQTLSQLKAVVSNYPGIIWSLDSDRCFTLYNGVFFNSSDENPSGIVGQNIHVYIREHPGVLHPSIPEKVESTFKGEPQDWMMELKNAVFRCNTMPIQDSQGNITGVVGAAVNVTGMIQMQKDLEEARRTAEAANHAKSEFLSRMSHEIRTPLNAIIGMINIGTGTGDVEKKDYCFQRADSASKHLLGLINDILDMSKIEANKFELSYSEFDFEQVLKNVTNMANIRAEEKKQNFIVNIANDVPVVILSDELRLSQIITNLLTNAIKFTPVKGTITLNIDKIEEIGDSIVLKIEILDTGIGISEEQQKRLFMSFNQANSSISQKFGGTGLGLAISKRIVELMGGKIWIESELGKGSKFIFTLRIKKVKEKVHAKILDKIYRDEIHILAVDDSEDTRNYFLHTMGSLKLSCDVASGGHQALYMVKNVSDKPYNIFFIDWQMPDMDGIELTKKIKEINGGNSIVIMISASDWNAVEKEAIAAGVKHFISKPLFPSTLINAINICMGAELNVFAAGTENKVPKHSFDFHNHTLLIAEDVEINREIMGAILSDTGVSIDYAENGKIAVSLFQENSEKYSLVLMDINMPEMDGYEATRKIRSLNLPGAKEIPIIAMTANVFKEDIEKCLESGMNNHTGKPIDANALFELLNTYLTHPDSNA